MKKAIIVSLLFVVIISAFEISNIIEYKKYSDFTNTIVAQDNQCLDSIFYIYTDITDCYLSSIDTTPSYRFGQYLKIDTPLYPKYYRFWDFYFISKEQYFDINIYAKNTDQNVTFTFKKNGRKYKLTEIKVLSTGSVPYGAF